MTTRRSIERIVEVSLSEFDDEDILAEVERRGIAARCDCTAERQPRLNSSRMRSAKDRASLRAEQK